MIRRMLSIINKILVDKLSIRSFGPKLLKERVEAHSPHMPDAYS